MGCARDTRARAGRSGRGGVRAWKLVAPRQCELLEPRGPSYHAIVSNRNELDAAQLVHWHRQKAGTIEQVHRVMKDELGAGVLPAARFGANAAWFRVNSLTFNVLTVLKRRALP